MLLVLLCTAPLSRSYSEELYADAMQAAAFRDLYFDWGGSMPRIVGLEKSEAPWHLRWFYGVMRKMFGRDLTPTKLQMRVPGIVWGSILMETAMGRKRRISLRFVQLAKVRTAARVGCPF